MKCNLPCHFVLSKHGVIGWGFGCGSEGAALANNDAVFDQLPEH
jgi:hypothetical protein